MRLTTKGRFAVTAMIDLALREHNGPVTLAGISQRQKISLSYLEQLFGKLRRHQRTFIARLINTLCERDYEAACYDTATHAERFKRLARTIHPGEYPSLVYLNVWADALYNGEMRSYESEVDAAYRSCDVDKVTRVLSRRPGVFARQLNRALRYFSGDQQQVADAFCQVAPRVAAPLLVQMHNM